MSKQPVNTAGFLSIKTILFLLFLLYLGLNFFPVLLLLFIGGIPSILAASTFRRREKNILLAVCISNLCGIFIVFFDLLLEGISIERLFYLLSNPRNLLLLYLPAALGVVLFLLLPEIFLYIENHRLYKEKQLLEKSQKHVLQEWGEKVLEEESDLPKK